MKKMGSLFLSLCVLSVPNVARATDIWGVRVSGAASFGERVTSWSGAAGGTFEFFVDSFGFRGGADVGYLGFSRGDRGSQLTFDLEGAVFVGPDEARWRPYFLLVQPVFSASSEVFEGLRAGPEIEWRDICASNLRIALAALYQPMRAADGIDWASFGPRLTITWGKPTLGCPEVPRCVPLPGRPCRPT